MYKRPILHALSDKLVAIRVGNFAKERKCKETDDFRSNWVPCEYERLLIKWMRSRSIVRAMESLFRVMPPPRNTSTIL